MELAGPHRVEQRVVVDHPAARGVDQHGRFLHQPQFPRADHAARLVGQRHVQRHEVRLREQLVERDIAHAEICFRFEVAGAVVVEHGHVEPLRPTRDLVADVAQPDYPQRLVVYLLAEHEAGVVFEEVGPTREVVALDDVARPRQQQREGDVGGGPVEDMGRVAHRDAPLRCRRQVDVVAADTEVADHLEPGDVVHQLGRDRDVRVRVDPVDPGKLIPPGVIAWVPAHDPAPFRDHRHDRAVGLYFGHHHYVVSHRHLRPATSRGNRARRARRRPARWTAG